MKNVSPGGKSLFQELTGGPLTARDLYIPRAIPIAGFDLSALQA
jgi:hypothetical protein